jgi:uncharacterized membrane protein
MMAHRFRGRAQMGLLVLGLAIFFSVHVFTSFIDARDALIAVHGERKYKAAYSLLSAAGLGFMIWGMRVSEPVGLWSAPAFGRDLALWLMPLAFILLAGAYVPSNLKRVTAHPMLWGVALWSILHLLANGDLASVFLFGSFALYSFYAMWSQTERGAKPSSEVQPLWRDVLVVVIGFAVYGAAFAGHRWLSGVSLP